MKTNGTTVVLLIAAALCGFSFHLGERRATAAGGITGCSTAPCQEVYCWWVSDGTTQSYSVQIGTATWPFVAGDNTTYSIPSIYVVADAGNKLPQLPNGTCNKWKWTSCSAICAPAKGGAPNLYEVLPDGTAVQTDTGMARTKCTPH